MPKNNNGQLKTEKRAAKLRLRQFAAVTAAVLLMAATTVSTINSVSVGAQDLQQQIDQLANENANNEQVVKDLSNQAVSYQDAIKRMQGQITIVQGQIADNRAKQISLQEQIRIKQLELDKQRATLGDNLKAMYVKEQISTVEMLATSKSLSDFIDAETYRGAVQSRIQNTLKEITRLQNQLSEQKVQVDRLLADQQRQEAELVGLKAEQDRLLALNLNQQSEFNKKTAANQSKINELIAEQARLNDSGTVADYYFLRFPGQVHGFNFNDYPYKNAGFSMSTAPGCVDNDGPDKWLYCTRQCVSYAAWAVEASGRTAPVGYGNAKDWVAAARRAGVAVYTTAPKAGDVAISTAGTWGHAMYVEKVEGNQVYVSQYNSQLTGQYSTQWRTFR